VLAVPSIKFDTAILTSPGGREANQDLARFRITAHAACWVVADGLGGHAGGADASRIAIETVLAQVEQSQEISPASLAEWVDAANRAIIAAQSRDPALSDMRTTIVVLASDFQTACWCHAERPQRPASALRCGRDLDRGNPLP
jgi:serine/threonine protein phosphatase PrpC